MSKQMVVIPWYPGLLGNFPRYLQEVSSMVQTGGLAHKVVLAPQHLSTQEVQRPKTPWITVVGNP